MSPSRNPLSGTTDGSFHTESSSFPSSLRRCKNRQKNRVRLRDTALYYIQRLRYLDGIPLILDHNYFSAEQITGLTPEIARHSVYAYLENELGMTIATSKRTMTVERMTQVDETYLDLKDYTCLAVITNQTYDDNGIQFEYTQSRHRPDYFQFPGRCSASKKK